MRLHKAAGKILTDKYNIKLYIDSIDYDYEYDKLDDDVRVLADYKFMPDDIIIVAVHDTCFYSNCSYGLNIFLHNLYIILRKYDIPREFLLLLSNYYGIQKEIETMNSLFMYDIIRVHCTPLWYDFFIDDTDIEDDCSSTDYLYTCVNNIKRLHRVYTLCKIKEEGLYDQGIISHRWN